MDFRFKLQEQTADQKPLGFRLTVEIVGFFTIGDQIPPEKVELQTRVNGVSVLYGILRGLVANVTGSFPVGKLVLPTVMPQDIVNDVERRKAEERNKEAAKLPHESIKSSEGI